MKKRIKTIAFIFFSLLSVAKAQDQGKYESTSKLDRISVGLKFGLNFVRMAYSDPALKEYSSSLYGTGLFGLFSEIGLNEANSLSLRPEITFLSRGQKIDDQDVSYKFRGKYTDFFLPVVYTYQNLKNVKPFVAAGPVVGFARGGKIELDGYKTGVTKANLKSTDFGIYLGAGAKFPVAIREIPIIIGAELGWYLGLTDTYSSKEQSGDAYALNTRNYEIDGTRKHRGVELAVSAAVPLSVFEKIKPPKKKEKPEKEPAPEVVVVPEKECYTLEEMKELIAQKGNITGKKICAVKQISFEFGKSTLTENDKVYLDEIVDLLKQSGEIKMRVNGHTDNVGSDSYNMELSKNRAKAVYDYLVSQGIAASRLSYDYFGAGKPIATNETEDGRTINRRVEFEITNY